MKRGRQTIICNKCGKDRLNFGMGMCSACLRNHKRKTRPKFYLGTCYSEMSRRVKTFDPQRPNYFGLEKCTKEEFINKFENDIEFLRLFKNWQLNEHERKFAPSIDRIDNSKGYTLDNIQFIQHNENSKKDCQNNIELSNYCQTFILESQREASNFLGISPSYLCILLRNCISVEYNGWTIRRINV